VIESAKDMFLGVDPPPRTTYATTCPVWNGLLNNLVYLGTCLAGDMDYRFKCDTLEIRMVQSGRLKCGTLTHCNVTAMARH
jgi:hypothetical protein